MSDIEALGYLGLNVSDTSAWVRFATDILGTQAVRRNDDTIDLRMDDYATRLRLIAGEHDDLAFAGWEVRDAAALAALGARLAVAGVEVHSGTDTEAADRRVAGLIRFADPEGNAHEAYFGPLQRTDQPFISPTGARFRTGRQGLGHLVLSCRDKPSMLAFFTETLGFRVSDHIRTEIIPGRPIEISFLRCNGRHHSLALAPVAIPKRIVHFMVEFETIDDVGRALDRCEKQDVHLTFTLGRHSNDQMLSFYALTPSGFDVEIGWGGLEVDDERWHVVTHDCSSAWGHNYQRPKRPENAT